MRKRMSEIITELQTATIAKAIELQKEYCSLEAKIEKIEIEKTKYNQRRNAIALEYHQPINH